MLVRSLTVGPLQENCWIVAAEDGRAFVVDPGEEADRIVQAVDGLTVEAILLTHTHVDHVGAVAPLARATGAAPVYCPVLEADDLRKIVIPFPGLGPYEGHEPEELLQGGETLALAGERVDVLFTPGHSRGHLSFSLPDRGLLLSGDVLFQGSVGRTDLPGGDHETLLRSIAQLLESLPADTRVLPGHMGSTTLGDERAHNPFLQALSA